LEAVQEGRERRDFIADWRVMRRDEHMWFVICEVLMHGRSLGQEWGWQQASQYATLISG
jgi:hypothetical protein